MFIRNLGFRTSSVRRLALLGAALLAVLALAACGTAAAQTPTHSMATPVPPASLATISPAKPLSAAAPAVSGPVVNIENFNFVPADLTVPAGSTVTWINHDDAPHTVTASDKAFSSTNIDTDGQFSFTFTSPGTYTYFCAIHPFMTAKVIVQ